MLFAIMVFIYFSKLSNIIKINNNFLKMLATFLKRKWYFDEIYSFLFVKNLSYLATILWQFFDQKIIDGIGPKGFPIKFIPHLNT